MTIDEQDKEGFPIVVKGISEICELLGIGQSAFHGLVNDGLPVRLVHGKYRGSRDRLLEWWESYCAPPQD